MGTICWTISSPLTPRYGTGRSLTRALNARTTLRCNVASDPSAERSQRKEALYEVLKKVRKSSRSGAEVPLTPVSLNEEENVAVRNAAEELESLAPSRRPLMDSPELVDGYWMLLYSDAREITSLASLPWGFKVTRVEQNVKLETFSFENFGFVSHQLGLLGGYVNIKAIFAPSLPPQNLRSAKLFSSSWKGSTSVGRRLSVNFQRRVVVLSRLFGFIPIPKSIGTVFTQDILGGGRAGPGKRIPTLDITYLDTDVRIGRGGEGSLFVLEKVLESAAS